MGGCLVLWSVCWDYSKMETMVEAVSVHDAVSPNFPFPPLHMAWAGATPRRHDAREYQNPPMPELFSHDAHSQAEQCSLSINEMVNVKKANACVGDDEMRIVKKFGLVVAESSCHERCVWMNEYMSAVKYWIRWSDELKKKVEWTKGTRGERSELCRI